MLANALLLILPFVTPMLNFRILVGRDQSALRGTWGGGRISSQSIVLIISKIQKWLQWTKADSKSISYHPQKTTFFFKFTLLDVDECSKNVHSCDVNAACTNTPGSYSCACNARYSGNGTTCVLGKKIICLRLTKVSTNSNRSLYYEILNI